MWRNGVKRERLRLMLSMALVRNCITAFVIELGSWDRVLGLGICIFRYHGECTGLYVYALF